MEKITTVAELKSAIQELENKQAQEWPLLKEQFRTTSESLKPLNLIKSAFKDVTASSGIKDTLLGATVGLTAGYLSKTLIVGASQNPFKKLLGDLLQLGVSTIVSKNPEAIKSLAEGLLNFVGKKEENNIEHSDESPA